MKTIKILSTTFLFFAATCLFVLMTCCFETFAQTTVIYNATGNSTFTVPAGVNSVTVEAWGGGGGGGYSNAGNTNKSAGGGGGGGGGYRTGTFSVTGGQTITIVVGAGGSGATADGAAGIAGGNTSVTYSGTSIVANGGGGGKAGINNTTGGSGGTGGSGTGGSGGYSGAAGGNGTATIGGSGGGGAGDIANANGISGGLNSGGNGGTGGTSGNNGSNGSNIGGGGGGTGDNASPPHVGGSGARGEARISYTCTTYSITGVSGSETCASSGTSTITVTSTANGLPVGTYTVTYSRSTPAATNLTATMQVTTAGTGTFTATGLTTAGTQTVTITGIGSGSGSGAGSLCNTTINSNNTAYVVVTSAVPSQPGSISGNVTPCEGSTQTYSVTNVGGVTYNWTLPAGWTQTGGGTSNSITVIVGSGSGNIQVTPSNGCGNGTARTLAVTVNTPTIIGYPGSRCGAGTGVITLSASASSGTINWYNASGSWLAAGNTYTTPVLSTTTTYYAEATNGGCTSARIPVTAYIITPPALSAGGDGTYCYGTNINLSSTLSGADNVYWEGPNGFYSNLANPVLSNATPAMSGTYIVNSNALSGINLVINGDFESGNSGFTSAYTNNTNLQAEGTYAVVANPNSVHTGFTNCADHTATGTLQMVINGAITPGVTVWSQTVNVVPNTYYQFTYWVQSVVGNNPSELQLYINGVSAGPVYTALVSTCNWSQFLYNWNSNANTTAILELKNQNIVAGGNDFALDDIIFQHTCTALASVNVTVNGDVTAGSIGSDQTICRGYTPAALTSTVAGTGSGSITYEWETNSSGTYVTIPGATAANYSPPPLNSTTSFRRRTVSSSGGAICYSGYTNVLTITVNGPTATAGGPDNICQSSSPSAITLSGASFGGGAISAGWSIVSGGGSLSSTVQTATPATVTYTPAANYSGVVILRLTTSASPCAAIADRIINIIPAATVVAGTTVTACSNSGAVNITAGASAANYSSIIWTSNGTGTFTNANSLTLATYTPSAADIAAGSRTLTLTAFGNSPCGSAVSTKTLTITSLPSATISYAGSPFCKSLGTVQLVTRTGTAGGSYSASPSGLSINALTGEIAPSTSLAGTYTVTYTMAAAGGCSSQTATTTVTITALPTATISYAGSPFCKSLGTVQPVTRTGTTGGSYSASPSGLSINASTGDITPSTSLAGAYTVTYTMAAAGGCSSQTATTTVTITTPPVATFSYAGSPYCKNAANPSPTFTGGGVAGTFTSSSGLVFVSAATGQINLAASTPGTYTVTNTIAASGGCSVQTATASITITALPTATISYAGAPFCQTLTAAQSVTLTGTMGGIYSAVPSGLSINTTTGAIIPSTSNVGTYTVTYTMAAAGGCALQTATTTVTILPDGSWTGAIDREWNNPGNWACNQLPTIFSNVTIANGLPNYPIVSSDPAGTAKDITIGSNASVTVTGGTLQIAGTIYNNGTFTATEGTIEMKGSTAQTIGANVFNTNTLMNLIINNPTGVTLQGPLNITGYVRPLSGDFNSSGNLTLISTAAQTALIEGSGTGTVKGIVNIQRYLPSSFGYKYFSSPFQSATVGAFASAVNLTETFPTFYKYDENNSIQNPDKSISYKSGWVKYTAIASPLTPMAGYAANLGTNTSSLTITISGQVNNGALSLALENNDREFSKGFNLVGNPYPSPIDWNASGWTKVNIDNAIYFFNAGNTDRYTGVYSSYVNGVSSGNANNVIAAMQGFFVHVSDGSYPVKATLGATNSVRINNLNPGFKDATIDTRPTLRLRARFEIKDAIHDAAVIYFDPMAGNRFEQDKDALKLNNTDILVPNIYTMSPDGSHLSINGLSMASDSLYSVPVGITTFSPGWINLRAENVKDLSFFEQVILKDALTGQMHDLRKSADIRFYLDKGTYDKRFSLLFSKGNIINGSIVAEKLFTLVRKGNSVVVKVNLPDDTKGNLSVTNLLGQTLLQKEVFAKETVEISSDLSTGVYIITLVSGKRTASEKILMRTDYE